MIIRTQSGSSYVIVVKNGKVYFQRGTSEGVVVSLSGLEVGKKLTMEYHPLNIYSQELDSIATLTTTTIVSIS